MAMRTVAFQPNVTKTVKLTAPKTSFGKSTTRSAHARPSQLRSEFVAPVASLKGLCASFTQLILDPVRRAVTGVRLPLLVEANRKKGLGATLYGTRRKRARVSGFRARMATPGGRKVLAARRKKGRKSLAPAGRPVRK